MRDRAFEPYLLNLTKANSRSTVHRPAFFDYVGVKRFDSEGRVIGDGASSASTPTAYHANAQEIPILRRKVAAILERAPSRPAATTRRR